MSASLLVFSVFMCDRKRGYGGHIDFINPLYPSSFGYYAKMVLQIEFIIYTNIQLLRQKFFTKGQGQRSRSKIKKNVLCEVNHEYRDDLIKFPAFYR